MFHLALTPYPGSNARTEPGAWDAAGREERGVQEEGCLWLLWVPTVRAGRDFLNEHKRRAGGLG